MELTYGKLDICDFQLCAGNCSSTYQIQLKEFDRLWAVWMSPLIEIENYGGGGGIQIELEIWGPMFLGHLSELER